MTVLWIFLTLVVLIGLYVVLTYNRLVSLKVNVEEAWSDIEVQMKRRYNLVPNLVTTVKGYAKHEKGVFTEVTKARNFAMKSTGGPESQGKAEGMFARFAVVAADLIDEMLPVADEEGSLEIIVVGTDPSGRFRSLDTFVPDAVPEILYADTAPDDIAVIAYTSGTTGRPKGAVHSHGDLIAATETYFRHCVDPREDDVIAGPPSIPFTLGMGCFIYFPLWFGAAAHGERQTREKIQRALVICDSRHLI